MSASPRFAVFAIVFAAAYAVIYVFAVEQNWALFTYHPATNTVGPLTTKAPAGPSMYWYGWMSTAALGAGVLAALVAALPEGLTRKIPPLLSWAVPLCAIVAFCFLLKGFFLR
ncbi:MAG: hypothetical protein WDO17_05620 [Alphaproteobacteria bacterium]